MATEICQYCGVDLDASPPRQEPGWLYGIECSACPAGERRSLVMARAAPAASLTCPDCGATLAPPLEHPDVLVVKEVVYEVCAACGERCGVARVRRVRDLSNGTM